MEIQLSTVQGFQVLMDQVYRASLTDLNKALTALGDGPAESRQEALMELLPELGAQYANVAGAVAATFAEEVLALQGLTGPPVAPAEAPAPGSWKALAGAATAPEVPNRLYFDLLTGGLVRRLTQTAADTVYQAGEAVGVSGYQRVTRPGCCAFCAMLASRGDAYTSAESALRVRTVGKAVETSYKRDALGNILYSANGRPLRKRGGQAKGIRTRGSRRAGETFHDHCKCTVVPVHEGNRMEMDAAAEAQREAYTEAYNAVASTLTPQTTRVGGRARTVFVDSDGAVVTAKDRTNRILNHMRRNSPAS